MEKKDMPKLPRPENMPRTPDPLPVARSIGGLAERAGVGISENKHEQSNEDLKSLRDRAEGNNNSAPLENHQESEKVEKTEEFTEIEVEES
jgi:hypothetical protein